MEKPDAHHTFTANMLVLAATALEKLQAVPAKLWLNVVVGLLVFIALVIVVRKAAEMNKVVLGVIVFVVLSCVGLNWIYARNEPAFMTPFIERLATFFPSAEKKAQQESKIPR